MTLGENITRLRTERGLSQERLAERLEVSRQSVSKWETNASVPELDKLVRLADVFGITLDELVRGEVPCRECEGDGAPHSAPQPPGGLRTQHLVGTVLLCFGALIFLLFLLLGGGLGGLLFAAPLLLCGALCLAVRRRVGLWCGWVTYVLVVGYLRYATGLSWQTVFQTFRWTVDMNYMRLAIAWGMALFLFLLLAATLRSFRALTIPCGKKQAGSVAGGWLALFAVRRLESRWLVAFLAQHQNLTGYGYVLMLHGIAVFAFDLLAVALLVLTAALLRGRRNSASDRGDA